ncbi:hypothetical protein BTA51_24660 [Hahella sp. CCB-MM4]|uniref:DUF2798 domain-containing protein n=1 Tax=Hahella sp. (strain CCB-MM4) TaxID=1926491 RepID=UPI000B9BECA2|nr:DUF2798 domain-containing protein [Hahella sp. CCB-MM4]OZG70775.1 hypothetical protein BTA51_24660 [Hahella sp. CCB-MM4]
MTLQYRLIFALFMSLALSILMTAWVTWINLGLVDGFIFKWGTAFITAWPAAAVISFLVGPRVHLLTTWTISKKKEAEYDTQANQP